MSDATNRDVDAGVEGIAEGLVCWTGVGQIVAFIVGTVVVGAVGGDWVAGVSLIAEIHPWNKSQTVSTDVIGGTT